MPRSKKVDEAARLSEEMLHVLETRRTSGDGDGPLTLRRLAELCGGPHAHEHILKAANKPAFKSRAVVTGKVDGKPTLDSPVYRKGEEPKKKDKVLELAERMLLVLEAQRRLGSEAYPTTLRRLAELCERNPSDADVPKAASHKALSGRVIVAAKGKLIRDAPVFLAEDLKVGASAILPALLKFALQPVRSKQKGKEIETHAFTPADLKKRFVPNVQKPFDEAVEGGIERQDLPETGWVVIKGKPHLFLLENLRPGAAPRPLPTVGHPAAPSPSPNGTTAAPAQPAREFAEAFREAFDAIDRRNGLTNFVKLSELRRALPEFGREAFDAELRKLRIDGLFSLDSHEGLYGSLTPEEREAGVREAGSLLIYASRR